MPKAICKHGQSLWQCKECRRESHREYQRGWVAANPERYKAAQEAWKEEHPSYWRIYLRGWRLRHNKLLGTQFTERLANTKNDYMLAKLLEAEIKRLKLR